ncbi:hypothetical protein HJC23_003641 [Cyclotella cryptica]|uniref:30S ribosomal protein S9, chloroplastic n=1 Tax=Cyclotella cryptica TaxID=29204 RepID=A0ABD3QJA0_9STRA|eukprot:CCRYP_004933-RA/>CCRYP_004933-RA protein AED:0.43 eAED:0.43 QI:0/-1/0/1/-1/1/1/0/297
MASVFRGSLLAARLSNHTASATSLVNAFKSSHGATLNFGKAAVNCIQPSCAPSNKGQIAVRCHSYGPQSSHPERKDVFRVHAVSLYQGDYTDEEDDAQWDDKEPVPDSKALIDPKEFRKMDEEEESTWWLYDGTEESREALAAMRLKEAQKQRWIQNASPPIRVSEIDERGRAYGRGSRKTAQARVWIQPGQGEIVVNRKDFVSYFPRESDREHVLGPFVASQTCGKFDVTAIVKGGGLTGQAGAIRLGLARALEKYNPDYRPPMKRHGFMTRDPRMVERKKVGRVKARKSPQWVRR